MSLETLETAFGALLQAIGRAKQNAAIFMQTLTALESTLNSIHPNIQNANWSSPNMLNRFVQQLERARALVDMYYAIGWYDRITKRSIRKELKAISTSLPHFLEQDATPRRQGGHHGRNSFRANMGLGLGAAGLAVRVAQLGVPAASLSDTRNDMMDEDDEVEGDQGGEFEGEFTDFFDV